MLKAQRLKKIFLFFLFSAVLFSTLLMAKKKTFAAVIPQDRQSSLIWFGDSRTVRFGKAVYGYKSKGYPPTIIKKHIIAKASTTLSWARGTGYRKLSKRLKKRPDSTVIFNFGVNDIGRGQNHRTGYLSLIKKIHSRFPLARLCFMSVNPVRASSRNPYAKSGSRAAGVNRRIASFNSYISNHLPKGCIYINTNRHVHFSYLDGLHYTKATYRRISFYVTGRKKLKK